MFHAYTSVVYVFIQILLFISAVAQLQGGSSDFYQTSIHCTIAVHEWLQLGVQGEKNVLFFLKNLDS